MLMVLLALAYFFVVPFEISFVSRRHFYFGWAADLLLWADMCFKCHLSYQNSRSVVVTKLSKIRKHYLKTSFLYDAFAAALNALSDEDAYSDERVVQAYVYTSDKRHELRGDWDYDAFRAEHLEAYVRMCDEFREDIEDNDLPGDDSSCEGTDDDA